ncbi:MAG: bifunctional hydroxymethylpyrimidine kinase/phosphomethylpyrimidine kinase [Streptococcus sp.]|nr:bifunctional hydroxymethylpyrimidine kinase/phosphomethylpyrimidine kinase [Streptococcus sp.]
MKNKLILAISGNDIYSGGGLHADLTTYTVNKLHGFVAVTCLTTATENDFNIIPIDTQLFEQQLVSLTTIEFGAIKIGLLPNIEIAELTLQFIKENPRIPVVLDPVLVCKEKHDVAVSNLRDELIKFFPYVDIVTPNLIEAQLLTQTTLESTEDMKEAAKIFHDLGAPAVVIKGGNRFNKEEAVDVFYDGQNLQIISSPVLLSNNTGAGCTFASSIASQLLLGQSLWDAVKISKKFVYQAIRESDQYGVIPYENE